MLLNGHEVPLAFAPCTGRGQTRDRCQVHGGWPALQAALGLESGQMLSASVVIRQPLKLLFSVVEQHPEVSLHRAVRTPSRSQLYVSHGSRDSRTNKSGVHSGQQASLQLSAL